MTTHDDTTTDEPDQPSRWMPLIERFPAWVTEPEAVDLDAVSSWGGEAASAKAVALIRLIRFGRQHRWQTEVNAGRVPGAYRKLADLCTAFGVTERHGRNARDIWDHVAANSGKIPEDWFGLGSGTVHDLVKCKSPEARMPRSNSDDRSLSAEVHEPITAEELLGMVIALVDEHAPAGTVTRREWYRLMAARLGEQDGDVVRDEQEPDASSPAKVEAATVAGTLVEPPHKDSWSEVLRIRSLDPEALAAEVGSHRLMVDRVWVAHAAQHDPVQAGDLLELVYGGHHRQPKSKPTRGIREKLVGLCVDHYKDGGKMYFPPLDEVAHQEQVRYRRRRDHSEQLATSSQDALEAREQAILARQQGVKDAA